MILGRSRPLNHSEAWSRPREARPKTTRHDKKIGIHGLSRCWVDAGQILWGAWAVQSWLDSRGFGLGLKVLGRSGQVLAKPRANLRQGRHRGLSTGRPWPADGDSDPIFLKNWTRFQFPAKTSFYGRLLGVVFGVCFFDCFLEPFWTPKGCPKGSQKGPKSSKNDSKRGLGTPPKQGSKKGRLNQTVSYTSIVSIHS